MYCVQLVTETNIFSFTIIIANKVDKVNKQIRKVDPIVRSSQELSSCNTFPVVYGGELFRYPFTTAHH